MKMNIGLNDKTLDKVSALLYQVLADEAALAFLTRDAHWNITGPLFGPLHELFGKQYDAINETIDDVAERIRALGRPVAGKMNELAKVVSLPSSGNTTGKADKLIGSLLNSHEAIIRNLRKAVDETAKLGDNGTSDFLTSLMEEHEKTAWMLRSSL